MKQVKINKTFIWMAAILLLGFWLRFHHYAQLPVGGRTRDEFAWTWLGMSLIQGQAPTSWTNLPVYDSGEERVIDNMDFVIISPYLDNPPLFAFIPGAVALLRGVGDLTIPPLTVIRLPMVILGTVNIWLLFLAMKTWFDKPTALGAAVVYACLPTVVLTSRMVMAENLLVTWELLAFWLLYKSVYRKLKNADVLLGLVGGLSVLTKMAGGTILLASVAFLWLQGRRREAIRAAMVGLVISMLFPLFGLVFDWDLFVKIQTFQSSQAIGWATLLNFFLRPQLVARVFVDGWFILGLVALVAQFFLPTDNKGQLLIKTFTLFWFIFFLAAINQTTVNGWYRYPIYPLMAMVLGSILMTAWRRKDLGSLIALNLFGVLPSLRLIFLATETQMSRGLVRWGIIVAILPILMVLQRRWGRMKRILMVSFLAVAVVVNVVVVLLLTPELLSEDDLYFFPIRMGI